MAISKIEIERFSVTTSKPFEAVLAALESAVGHPDMAEFARSTAGARTFAELDSVVRRSLGRTGLMMFMELDHGAVMRKETGRDTPKMVRALIGNALIMKEMAKHVPEAGSYAPVTILVDERADGVHLSLTRWQASSVPIAIQTPSPSLASSTPRSKGFFEKSRRDESVPDNRCSRAREARVQE